MQYYEKNVSVSRLEACTTEKTRIGINDAGFM